MSYICIKNNKSEVKNQCSKDIRNWILDIMQNNIMPNNIIEYYGLIKDQLINEKRTDNDILIDVNEDIGYIIRANRLNPIEVNKFISLIKKKFKEENGKKEVLKYKNNLKCHMSYKEHLIDRFKNKGDCMIINYENENNKYINGFFYKNIMYQKESNVSYNSMKLLRKLEDATMKVINLELLKKEILNDIIKVYLLEILDHNRKKNTIINHHSIYIIQLAQYCTRDIELYIQLLLNTIKESGTLLNIDDDSNVKKWQNELKEMNTVKECIHYFQEKNEYKINQ